MLNSFFRISIPPSLARWLVRNGEDVGDVVQEAYLRAFQYAGGFRTTYLLQRLGVKSLGGLAKDRLNMSITLPAYIKDVAKVQIYCAWAEALLGEAPFSAPLMTMNK